MSESTLTTYTAEDGRNLAVQDWPAPEGLRPRGAVLIVHGLGEHAGRYDRLAGDLNAWGWAVRGYDQHGHGESDGERGSLPRDTCLVDDLADMVTATRSRLAPGTPLVLLGHSMGGLVAASLVARDRVLPDALVLSSPAFDAGLGPMQKLLVAVLPRIAPRLRVGNGLDAARISQDSAVVGAYRADPLVHDRISARLARFIAGEGPRVLACAPRWRVPTLLLYAGRDALVNPAGSRAFATAASRHRVESHCFDALCHEIFNEPQRDQVLRVLRRWLDARFGLTSDPDRIVPQTRMPAADAAPRA